MAGQIDGAANSVKIDWRVAWKHHAGRFMKGEHEEARGRKELWEMFPFVLFSVHVRGRLNSNAREQHRPRFPLNPHVFHPQKNPKTKQKQRKENSHFDTLWKAIVEANPLPLEAFASCI